MQLGLINSAWFGSPAGTAEGIRKAQQIGFDTIGIFSDPLKIPHRIVEWVEEAHRELTFVMPQPLGIGDSSPIGWLEIGIGEVDWLTVLSIRIKREYEENGFVLAKGFFDAEEIGLLRSASQEDRELDQHSFGRGDGEGGTVRLSLWNHPCDTLYGMFARCELVVIPRRSCLEARSTITIPR